MSFYVKYIGGCEDISQLLKMSQQEAGSGNKVVLVCDKASYQHYGLPDIPVLYNPEDVKTADSDIVFVCCENDAPRFAVDCASRLKAVECQVFTVNDGIYTADPATEEYSVRLDRIDYDEVIELCNSGYTGVDMDMVEKAKKLGVILRVLSCRESDGQGTIVKEVMSFGSGTVKGIIKEPDICIVSLREIPDVPGISYHIFQAVSEAGVNVDMISLPASDYGRQDISFTIHKEDKVATKRVLKDKQRQLGYTDVVIKDDVAKISVVGSGVKTSRGVAAKVFEILYENNINLRLISTSEIKINVFVDKADADLAVQKIHQFFIG